MEKTKDDLYEYLDWYAFVNSSEISMAVLDFMAEEMDIQNPSRWHCALADELATEYMKDRRLVLYED